MALTFSVNVLETIYTNTGWAIKSNPSPFQSDMPEWRKEIDKFIKWCDDSGLIKSETSFASAKGCYWQQNPYVVELIIKKKDVFTLFNLTWMNTDVSMSFKI